MHCIYKSRRIFILYIYCYERSGGLPTCSVFYHSYVYACAIKIHKKSEIFSFVNLKHIICLLFPAFVECCVYVRYAKVHHIGVVWITHGIVCSGSCISLKGAGTNIDTTKMIEYGCFVYKTHVYTSKSGEQIFFYSAYMFVGENMSQFIRVKCGQF